MTYIKKLLNFPKDLAILAIKFYQLTLSPDHSWLKVAYPHGFCRFYPSCSDYGVQALERFGLIKGLYLILKRIIRCHPWADPKFDPVPNN